MPMIIGPVVAVITAVTGAVVAAGPLAVAAFNAVNVLGAAALATAAFGAVQPDVKSSSASIEWNADPNAPNRFPFGRVGGAGNIVHNATFGPDLMYAGFVGVLGCSGPIKSYVGFKADQRPVTFDGTGMAVTSDYAGEMWVLRQRGLQPEPAALPTPTGLKNGVQLPNWGAAYKLSGKAAYIYILGENSKRSAFKGKVPVGIHTLEGLYCYDPRFDSTYPGGSGTCRLDDPTTWVYSTNAYIHALNWNIGRWEGLATGYTPDRYGVPYASMKVGGIGARPDGIDFAGYVEAANVFDENEWACAAWPDADQGKAAVLDSFLQAGGGIYAERQGRVSCLHRAAPRTSIATITADDTAGTIEYDTTTSLLERINTIRPEFWSEDHDWQMVATDEVTSSVWREEDGQGVEVTRSKGLAYNYVPGSKQARELAALQIAHTREPIRGTAPLRHYLDLEVGDCIDFDVPEAALNGRKVIILNVDPDVENDVLHVTFASETDAKYPFAFGQTDSPPPTLPPLTPSLLDVTPPQPGEWTLVGGTIVGDDGAEVPALVLDGTVENERATGVIFEYRRDGATNWQPYSTDGPTVVRKQILGLAPGSWAVAVSYREGPNLSSRLVLGPVTLTPIVVPLTPGVLDDGGVIRVPPGYTGGGLVVDTDTADRLSDSLGILSIKDTADTPEIEPNAVTDPTISAPSGAVSILSTTKVLIDSVTITVNAGERVKIEPSFDLDMISTAGTRGDSVAIAIVRIQRGLDSDPGVVYLTPNRRMHHVHADSAQYAMITLSANDFPPAGTHTYYVYGACVYAVSPPSTTVLVRERSTEVTRFKR